MQSDQSAKRRQIAEPDRGILREPPFQIVRERLRPGKISRECQRKGGTILCIAAPRKLECRQRAPPGFGRLAEPAFPDRRPRRKHSRPFPLPRLPRQVHGTAVTTSWPPVIVPSGPQPGPASATSSLPPPSCLSPELLPDPSPPGHLSGTRGDTAGRTVRGPPLCARRSAESRLRLPADGRGKNSQKPGWYMPASAPDRARERSRLPGSIFRTCRCLGKRTPTSIRGR